MIDYDDDDARRYDDNGDDADNIDYGDICPRCFEFWQDCVCEDVFRDDDDDESDE